MTLTFDMNKLTSVKNSRYQHCHIKKQAINKFRYTIDAD